MGTAAFSIQFGYDIPISFPSSQAETSEANAASAAMRPRHSPSI